MTNKNSYIIKKANDILRSSKTTPDKAATESVCWDIINKKMKKRMLGMALNDKKAEKNIYDIAMGVITELNPLLSKISVYAVVDSKNNIVDITINKKSLIHTKTNIFN